MPLNDIACGIHSRAPFLELVIVSQCITPIFIHTKTYLKGQKDIFTRMVGRCSFGRFLTKEASLFRTTLSSHYVGQNVPIAIGDDKPRIDGALESSVVSA